MTTTGDVETAYLESVAAAGYFVKQLVEAGQTKQLESLEDLKGWAFTKLQEPTKRRIILVGAGIYDQLFVPGGWIEGVLDPSTKLEMVQLGIVGTMIGRLVVSDAYLDPSWRWMPNYYVGVSVIDIFTPVNVPLAFTPKVAQVYEHILASFK